MPQRAAFAKNFWRFDPDISWYGPGFYGSGTACGQLYTKAIMGVAHRSLPCGTLVTFRNPANGRQVTVPVIDRGPYVAGRPWDMSKALCDYLDHCYTGDHRVALGRADGLTAVRRGTLYIDRALPRPLRVGQMDSAIEEASATANTVVESGPLTRYCGSARGCRRCASIRKRVASIRHIVA